MLNYGFIGNLITLSSLIAGFSITIVISLLTEDEAKKRRGETTLASGVLGHTKLRRIIAKFILGLHNESLPIFAFLTSAFFLITACISSAIIISVPNPNYQSKIVLFAYGTIYELVIGFVLFYFGPILISLRTKKWISVLLLFLSILSIAWISIVFFNS
jgi:hypothetical protein